MALILQIETSTSNCSVALAQNGELLALKEVNERNAHASSLTLFIEEVISSAGKTLGELNAVAASMGPGSYTGLRIGVSTAKGLCYALDVPLVAINTLEAMAVGYKNQTKVEAALLCPMIDARRMEVYTAVFDSNLNQLLSTEAHIVDENSFAQYLSTAEMHFFGDGAMKCKDILGQFENAVFIENFNASAGFLTKLALQKYENAQFEDVAYFEPFYLKDFLATQPKKSV
jgi:tRNA threonylcarbamoyladenosine biosynthesis protein TsaB